METYITPTLRGQHAGTCTFKLSGEFWDAGGASPLHYHVPTAIPRHLMLVALRLPERVHARGIDTPRVAMHARRFLQFIHPWAEFAKVGTPRLLATLRASPTLWGIVFKGINTSAQLTSALYVALDWMYRLDTVDVVAQICAELRTPAALAVAADRRAEKAPRRTVAPKWDPVFTSNHDLCIFLTTLLKRMYHYVSSYSDSISQFYEAVPATTYLWRKKLAAPPPPSSSSSSSSLSSSSSVSTSGPSTTSSSSLTTAYGGSVAKRPCPAPPPSLPPSPLPAAAAAEAPPGRGKGGSHYHVPRATHQGLMCSSISEIAAYLNYVAWHADADDDIPPHKACAIREIQRRVGSAMERGLEEMELIYGITTARENDDDDDDAMSCGDGWVANAR